MIPTQFWTEVINKEDLLPDDLRTVAVDSVELSMHLPYLLQIESADVKEVPFEEHLITVQFEEADRKTTYFDGHIMDDRYTVARVRISWLSDSRPSLSGLLHGGPLSQLMAVPLAFVESLLQAYQLYTGDFSGEVLFPMEVSYITGKIHLIGIDDPLGVQIQHRERDRSRSKSPKLATLLEAASGITTSEQPWLSRKTFGNARRPPL